MREIRFRAWDGKMLNCITVNMGVAWSCYDDCEIKGAILMQYTGLKDKNGKEIYEGDIVYWESSDNIEEVKWQPILDHETKTGYGEGWDLTETQEAKVIGNIYENPELKGVVDESQDYTSWHGKPIQLKGE